MIKIIHGIFIGISLVLPGMSGGTALIILGFYRSFLEDLSRLQLKRYLTVGVGTIIGVIVSVQLVNYLLSSYPQNLVSFLMGMLIGSIFLVFRPLGRIDLRLLPWMLIWGAIGIAIAWTIAKEPLAGIINEENGSPLILFAGGLLTSITMLLPGLSGSSVLIMIGLYDDLLQAVSTFMWLHIFLFGMGVALGMVLFSRLIMIVYKRFSLPLTFLLAGLLAGSTRALIPQTFNITVIICFVTGVIVVLLVNRPERIQN